MRIFRLIAVAMILLAGFFCSEALAYKLLVLGDCRNGSGNEDFRMTQQIIEDAVSYAAKGNDLRGIILTGDYVTNSANEQEWGKFKNAYQKAFAYPVYPCPGNHDRGGLFYGTWSYYDFFSVPRWYSKNIEGIHLVALDAMRAELGFLSPASALLERRQFQWLKQDLEADNSTFTIVIWHEPAYASHPGQAMGHGSNIFMRERYVALCENSAVDLILCGHNHMYERTAPIKNRAEEQGGIIHITTGGGGAPLHPLPDDKDLLQDCKGNALSQVQKSAYHFCVLTVENSVLTVEAIAYKSHELLDAFQITRRQH